MKITKLSHLSISWPSNGRTGIGLMDQASGMNAQRRLWQFVSCFLFVSLSFACRKLCRLMYSLICSTCEFHICLFCPTETLHVLARFRLSSFIIIEFSSFRQSRVSTFLNEFIRHTREQFWLLSIRTKNWVSTQLWVLFKITTYSIFCM